MENSEMKDKRAAAQKAEEQLDQLFYNIFEGHQDGQRILQDLQYRFDLRSSITGSPVDVYATLVKDGQREVVLYITGRIFNFQARQK